MIGYWVAVQIRTMRSSVIYKSKLRMGDMTHSIFLVIPFEIFFRDHLRSNRIIYLLVIGRVIVYGRGYSL